ncbi:HAD family phosphatase [Beijerinckia sp. L45]|uniref:HAD family hydrolase n=1 Tax=Beijerinckia sp. L45 TaxID=1641855 RepID=UPI00131C1C59|nr:HAD family hydrolase [Beijerinckia sp. L45]
MLLIFDCDGTLVDSELIALEVLSEMMGEQGVPMDVPSCMHAFMGKHNADIVSEIERLIGRALPDGEGARTRARMLARIEVELQPILGVADVLRSIEGPRCVASSSDPARIAHSLKLTGLASFFGDHVFSAAQVANGKPAPDLFLLAAATMGFAPQHCIVIEDSVAGVEAGVRAGMAVIGFAGGSHAGTGHGAMLEAAGANLVAKTMAALPDAIAALRRAATPALEGAF